MPFAPAEIARLEEEHLAALELRVQADLAAGRHAELVAELGRLTREHPLRERLHAHLMLALYRSGRQADALEAYQHARGMLVEQLGIEPGDELTELQQAILAHDPALGAPAGTRAVLGDGRLPRVPNRTIGRERQLATIADRLREGRVPLLTLTGPGGVGKTRLAIEAGRTVEPDFPDGACFVPLAALSRVEDVPMATVRALGTVILDGESAERAVHRFLAARRLLLVVDNCEHLPRLSAIVGGILESCPGVTVLATSREPLDLRAEERYPVPPLSLPAGSGDAVALFAERARAHDPDLALDGGTEAAISEICTRLDGLPLAIELAAARCSLLTPIEIALRLDAALGALGTGARDAPARHRTLRATIDWSHDLLDDEEQTCFARFAVFAGGATVEAVEAVTGARLDTVDHLVAKSLLTRVRQPDGRTRFDDAGADPGVRGGALRGRARRRSRAGTPLPPLPLARRAQRRRARPRGSGPPRAPRPARRRHREPARRAGLGRLPRGRRLGPRDVRGTRPVLADAETDTPTRSAGPRRRSICPAPSVIRNCRSRFSAPGPPPYGRSAAARSSRRSRGRRRRSRGRWPSRRCSPWCSRPTPCRRSTVNELEAADRLADEALEWAARSGDDWRLAMAAFAKAVAARTPADLRARVDRAAALLEQRRRRVLRREPARVRRVRGAVPRQRRRRRRVRRPGDARHARSRQPLPLDAAARERRAGRAVHRRRGRGPRCVPGGARASAASWRCCPSRARASADWPPSRRCAASSSARRGCCGAAGAQRYGQPHDPVDERLLTTFFDPARARLGTEAWDAAARRGAATSFEDAIASALEDRPVDPAGRPC